MATLLFVGLVVGTWPGLSMTRAESLAAIVATVSVVGSTSTCFGEALRVVIAVRVALAQ